MSMTTRADTQSAALHLADSQDLMREHGVAVLDGTYPAPLADSVDQAYTPTLQLVNLPQFKPTATFRRRKECLRFTGDQRINNKPEFIHQPDIDKARRYSSTPNEINVLARLLFKGSNFFESPNETRPWPER